MARSSLVTEVQDAIKDLILREGLQPGDALPTENELTSSLGISRGSLREALKVLEATGIVVIRRGYGMYVGEMSLKALVAELTFHAQLSAANGTKQLQNLVELRETLENLLVRRVAKRRETKHLEAIDFALQQMIQAAERGDFSPDADRLFHESLYLALDNPFISQLLSAFWAVLSLLEDYLPSSTSTPMDVATDHQKIYDAIADGDAGRAEAAMADHFRGISDRLQHVDAAKIASASIRRPDASQIETEPA